MNKRIQKAIFFGPVTRCLLLTTLLAICTIFQAQAQEKPAPTGQDNPEKLFDSDQTMTIRLGGPWQEIVQKEKNQNPYPATVEYTDGLGHAHTLALTVERRGLTRQTVCKYPPLRLRFEKEAVKGTVFHGQTSLKMVTHCDKGDRWEQYYIKELLAYRMYNLMTGLSFRVRPLSVTYIDSKNNSTQEPRFAFLIEDDGDVAKRNGLKKIRLPRIQPEQLDKVASSRLFLYQFMIGNVDWSALTGRGNECCHNGKLVGLDAQSTLYVIPYDFDSSGLVDAHYAAPNDGLPIKNVTQRLYRGFCAMNPTLGAAREEFLAKEQSIYDVVNNENLLNERNKKYALKYLAEYFDILRDTKTFDKAIIQKCRR